MSEKYKVRDQDRPYFITFAVEGWVDVFTRQSYKEIILESVRYCQKEKGLILYAWCLMTNHMPPQSGAEVISVPFKKSGCEVVT